MLIETGILDRNDGMLHVLWNFVDGNRDAVAFRGAQLLYLISVAVVYKGCIAERRDIGVCDLRRVGNDSAIGSDAEADAEYGSCDQ